MISSFNLLSGRKRSRGRCWADIRLSHLPEPSGHVSSVGRWSWQWSTTWSTVRSSAPHSEASERAIPHLYKQERKRPRPVRGWLSRSQAFLGRAILGEWVPISVMEVRIFVLFSNYSAFHRWLARSAVLLLLSSDEPMNCCATGTNGCLNLRCRAFPLSGQVSVRICWLLGKTDFSSK